MTQLIGDMDLEDAKISIEDLSVYTNDDQTYFVVFDLKYEGLDSNQVLVYVASDHVSYSNIIDHYELIATNTKLKKWNRWWLFSKKSLTLFLSIIGKVSSVTNQVKHLERVTSNEFDQFKNKVAFEKLQREIEQAKMSQESDLFN